MGLGLFDGVDETASQQTKETFEKRHPITHNLGVIDRKYLERALQDAQEGRDVRVTKEELIGAIEICLTVLTNLHARLFCAEAKDET